MLKQSTIGILCVCVGMISIKAIAENMSLSSPEAEQITIPGYTAPPTTTSPIPSHEMGVTPTLETATPVNSNRVQPVAASASGVPTPEEMNKSCQKFIPIGSTIDTVKQNLQGRFEEKSSGDMYRWTDDSGKGGIVINFLDDGTPVEVHGNLPESLGNANELNFKLDDVTAALNNPGVLQGHFYIFGSDSSEIKVLTDLNNAVTAFSTNVSCEVKK